jgi:hypothetical protein
LKPSGGQQEQAERFLAASPRPARRKPSRRRPGAPKPPESILHVTEDRERGMALVRGLNVRTVLEMTGVVERARWSVSAKGYVIPAADLADLAAMADYSNTPYRVKVIRGAHG